MKIQELLLSVVIYVSTVTLCVCESAPTLTVGPRPEVAIQPNENVTMSCTLDNKTIEWFYANKTRISEDDKSRIYFNNSNLFLSLAELNDTGEYTCQTTDKALNATVLLKVYEMPTYFTAGMIIVGVNCGLILVFIVCGINSLIQSKRYKLKRKGDIHEKSSPI